MLRCMASKPWMRLLNKLNKSSIIHPGPGVCLVHVDQRHAPAACNIPHWKYRSTGTRQQLAVNTVLCVQAWEPWCQQFCNTCAQKQILLMSAGTWRHDTLSIQHLLHPCQQIGGIVSVNIWCNLSKHWWLFMKPWVVYSDFRGLWKMPTAAVLSVHHHADYKM